MEQLPAAGVTRAMKAKARGKRVAGDARDVVGQHALAFLKMLAAQSAANCEKAGKSLLTGEHIAQALKDLGFERYVAAAAQAGAAKSKKKAETKRRKKGWAKSDAELAELQEAMLKESAETFSGGQRFVLSKDFLDPKADL